MTQIFLYINLFLFLIPFILTIDKKINLRSLFIPSLIVMVFFSETGVFFSGLKVWSFNPTYLLGVHYRLLPLEMYLLYFTLTFACLGVYHYLNLKFPKNDLQKYSLAWSNLLLGIMVAVLFFAYTKWYTVIIFAILFVLILFIEYKNQLRFMYNFYRAFVVCLIPFFISFGLLCKLPVIHYQEKETLAVDLFHIPLETPFYMMGMLLLGVYISEVIKYKKAK